VKYTLSHRIVSYRQTVGGKKGSGRKGEKNEKGEGKRKGGCGRGGKWVERKGQGRKGSTS